MSAATTGPVRGVARMPATTPRDGPLIPQFFAGRAVLITGGTGFMGKVLVERLLYTCPEVQRLYLLVRQKKGVPPERRLEELKKSQVFNVLKEKCPEQLNKLSMVPGDVTQPMLGLSAQSIAELCKVSVVFHSAATLKFNEALGAAVQQNVRSVVSLMDVCDKLPKLQVLMHVSTAYSNSDLYTVEERVYPAPVDLNQLLTLSEAIPDSVLEPFTAKYIAPKPNTYTFTKAMAECAVQQRPNKKYHVGIFRPSIVVSSLRHPFPGWIENMNGPSGVIVATGKGVLHIFRCRDNARADLLPVDIAIDTLIAATWEVAMEKSSDVRVYNCSTGQNPLTWKQFENALLKNVRENPLDKAFWYPFGSSVKSKWSQKVIEFLLQTVPLHVAEGASRLLRFNSRLNLVTMSQRLSAMNEVLTFFAMREWDFKSDNVSKLRARLSSADAAIYNLDPHSICWDDHLRDFEMGTRKYLLNEKDEDIESAKSHLRKLYVLHTGVLVLCAAAGLRLLLLLPGARSMLNAIVQLFLSIFYN